MRTFVFAIGGTGARVLKSLGMLLASGCKGTATNNTIVPIIIDYDTTNGDTERAQEVLKNYRELHNMIYGTSQSPGSAPTTDTFFCNPVSRLKDAVPDGNYNPNSNFEVFLTEDQTDTTFAEHIGRDTLSEKEGTQATRHLLEALYDNTDKESKTTELNLNLSKGFKGCPNIGCVVTKNLETTEELKQLFPAVLPDDKIIIIGSIFGGTGASGIPMLLDLIKANSNTANNIVGVVAVMPYFKVNQDSSSAINSDTFTAKTKAALDAYALGTSVNKQASAVYYVGDNYQPGAFNNSEGGKTQKNAAHLVELVAAMHILSFIENKDLKANIEYDADAYEFGYLEAEKKDIKAGSDPNILGFNRFFRGETLEPYIYPLCRLMIFSKFCEKYLLTCGDGERRDTWLRNTNLSQRADFKKALNKFIGYFYEWIDEIQDARVKRGVALFNPHKSYDELFKGLDSAVHRKIVKDKSLISNDDIRKMLGKKWDEDKIKGKKELNAERPEEFFIKKINEVTVDLMKKVVEYNDKKNQN